ncbi:MAG: hypothetical protein KAJ42_04075, partial [Gemmatimonadetes bacterium]|nr:hypothetical protein [Gemmatimonadota bacterium]
MFSGIYAFYGLRRGHRVTTVLARNVSAGKASARTASEAAENCPLAGRPIDLNSHREAAMTESV